MEQQGVDSLIAELEQTVHSALEQPDTLRTTLEYRLDLGNNYWLDLRDETDTEDDRHMTAAFVHRTIEPADERSCTTQLLFSCLYEHDDDCLHGIWYEELAESLMQDMAGENEMACLQSLIVLARHIHEHGDEYKAPPPFDEEELAVFDEIDDSADDTEAEPFKGLVFEVKQEALNPKLRALHENAMRHMSPLLAGGAYRVYRGRTLGEDDGPWLESNALSGPEEHFASFIPKLPRWSVSYVEEPLEHEFEQRPDGTYEAKVSPADHVLRYGNLPSFDALFDEDTQELLCSSVNEADIERAEQIDREAGLFVPTSEQVANFLRKLRLSLR